MILFQKVLDVWEGQLEVNEAELKSGGVHGLIIRLNDINGGHNMDEGFTEQWEQAKNAGMLRAPYFVYNPWITGYANFEWLQANCPPTHTVCIDVEVRKPDYSPAVYASHYAAFMSRAQRLWPHVVTYSGAWFVENLAYWPTTCEYWWARYPLVLYPPTRETWSWQRLNSTLASLPWNPGPAPARVSLWQCSGDRIILPGTTRAVDINVFDGTAEELRAWFGTLLTPPPPLTIEQKVEALWVHHPELH